MNILCNLIILALSAFVVVGAICRLNPMRPQTHKHGWAVMYMLMAGFAGFASIDVLKGHEPSFAVMFGLFSWALNLVNTRELWTDEPPASTLKGTS
jgi:hypothetical protein